MSNGILEMNKKNSRLMKESILHSLVSIQPSILVVLIENMDNYQ